MTSAEWAGWVRQIALASRAQEVNLRLFYEAVRSEALSEAAMWIRQAEGDSVEADFRGDMMRAK